MEQIKCRKHQAQALTNFCSNHACMTELCASCVSDHSEYHNFIKTKPHFQNIKEAVNMGAQMISKSQQKLTSLKERINILIDQADRKKSEVREILNFAKNEVISTVNLVFFQMEENIFQEIDRQIAKHGFGDRQKLEKIYSKVCHENIQLHQWMERLVKQYRQGLLKQINMQLLPNSVLLQQQIEKEIHQNQLFKVEVIYHPFSLGDLESSLRKLINISFRTPTNNRLVLRSRSNNSVYSKSPPLKTLMNPLCKQQNYFLKTDPYGFKQHLLKNSGLQITSKMGENKKKDSIFFKTTPI